MKKYHDQVLRNIYKLVVNEKGEYNDPDIHAELLTSSALPAHCYVAGFKNFNHLIDVIRNKQNNTKEDVQVVLDELILHMYKFSYKKLHLPEKFYDYLLDVLEAVSDALTSDKLTNAMNILKSAEEYIQNTYGSEIRFNLLEAYRKEHSLPLNTEGKNWHDPSISDPVYQEAWDNYFKYQKSLYFNGYWKYLSVLHNLQISVVTILARSYCDYIKR